MSYYSIPTPCCNIAYNQYGRNDCTIVASIAGNSLCANNLTSDKVTANTHCSTDIEIEYTLDVAEVKIPEGIFIPQHMIPWGGISTNKIAAKWKRRIKEHEKRRELKEANNPKYKSMGDIWKNRVADNKLQQSHQ